MTDKSSRYWRRRELFVRRHRFRRAVDELILALMEGYQAAPVESLSLKVENLDCVMQVVQWT